MSSSDPQTACQKIVDLANDRGGTDNISLIILSSEKTDSKEDSEIIEDEQTIIT